MFEAIFSIPGESKSIKLRADIMKQAALGKLKEESTSPTPMPPEDRVYEAMATDAFEAFGNKVIATFFGKDEK